MSTLAPTRRVDGKRSHSYLLDGERVDGVTWALGEGFPKPALIGWAANETADYATDYWDDLVPLRQSERNAILRKARFDPLRKASIRGQDIHAQLARLAAGEDVYPNDDTRDHVDSYLAFVRDWQPQELLTEVVVGNRKWRYMGTLDVVGELVDGLVWLLDFKTGKGVYEESALQLAAYRFAEFYLDALGAERPMPEVDACGVVHVRADGYDLYPVEVDKRTFRRFLYAQELARFRKHEPSPLGESLRAPGVLA